MDEEKKELIPYYKTEHLAATVNDVANSDPFIPDSICRELREAAEILRHVVLLRSRQCMSGQEFESIIAKDRLIEYLENRMIDNVMCDIKNSQNADEAFKFSDMKYDKKHNIYSKEMDFMIVLQPNKEEN